MIFSSDPPTQTQLALAQMTQNAQYKPPNTPTGAPVVWLTCVIMLAGPPAVAMTYVKLLIGLDPSLYGGGGSPSSRSLLAEAPSFVSRGSAAFVSATALAAAAAAAAAAEEGCGSDTTD